MATFQKVFKICPKCNGDKVVLVNDDSFDPGPPQEVPCPDCGGDGKILWGKLKSTTEEE